MEEKKALIGMSGGVDSSVAAWRMLQAGYNCVGATMRLFDSGDESSTCCSLEDVEDAKAVARKLGIPHHTFNFKADFDRCVMAKFARCYESGLTPNPCIDCNKYLKFDRLLHRAQELGCQCVASGHYAQIRRDDATGRYLMYQAADKTKDQTYFLACLNQWQLAHIQFPLGELTKNQVRSIAEEMGFVNARKRDSQDICFVPDGDYVNFLERYTGHPYPAGDFLDRDGKVVGRHRGAVAYTLGQRKGLGLSMGEPVYVCGKDMSKNTVTVGSNEALFSKALRGADWCWYPFETLTEPLTVEAKIRHSQNSLAARVYPEENGMARVEFEVPQRAVTPGQAVVLYQGELVIGGGTITQAMDK